MHRFKMLGCRATSFLTLLAGVLLALLVLGSNNGIAEQVDVDSEFEALKQKFQETDSNNDRTISLAEYKQLGDDTKMLERDFRLFDFDDSGTLDRDEFSCTPGVIAVHLRGPIPDPLKFVLAAAIDALDESMGNWSQNNTVNMHVNTFVHYYARSLNGTNSSQAAFSETTQLQKIADENGNQRISWEEGQRFLEVQLGFRTGDGQMLREPTGRVLIYPIFQWIDADKNGTWTKAEYLAKKTHADAAAEFDTGDLDNNGTISLEEFANPEWVCYFDPILAFRNADKNLDGLVDVAELTEALPNHRKPLAKPSVAAFDSDADGRLTLEEFRVSMAGNYVVPWEYQLTDSDRDRMLSAREYQYRYFPFQLLFHFYFSRLDTDDDGQLSLQEYSFKTRPPNSLHRMRIDGTEFSLVHSNVEYPSIGSPAISPDGTMILCDVFPPAGIGKSEVCLMTIDGKNPQYLAAALMPTWSPDGKQFACSRNGPDNGVWIMNIDGSEHKKIDDGWGAQWSPDGKWIAYTKSRAIWLYDVKADEKIELLPQADHDYRYIYYNSCWSPDSSRLLFKAYEKSSTTSDIASVAVSGDDPDLTVHLSSINCEADLAFFPDGKSILITLMDADAKKRRPYRLELAENAEPELLSGFDPAFSYNGATISPDGKWIVFPTSP